MDWGGDSSRILLLVHGQGGNAHNWDRITPALQNEFRVIAIDERGHGDSDHTDKGYTVTDFATALAMYALKAAIAPYDYIGASLGAPNGIFYGGDH